VLAGTRVLVATGGSGLAPLGAAVSETCARLGADVASLTVDPAGEQPAVDAAPALLVWDGDGAFTAAAAAGPEPSVAAVHAALDGAWLAVRPAGAAMAAAGAGGKVVLVAPRPGGPHAEAARAGLENLARTLGIEWARFQVRTVAILPGTDTAPGVVADLAAYVASPAGDYFSGCALTLS
jgi:NAD(P)-dependent dehydrogenase (short-subunit alcohol dehydrogenase family)